MRKPITIAIDAMGGDHGPSVTVPAALNIIKKYPGVALILVGDHDTLNTQLLKLKSGISDQLSIHHASQTVEMDELPSHAMRNKKDSSMRVSLNLVKEGLADACVSAGNTGALMATARFVLKMLPGIDRPAICSELPTITGHTLMLDLGANVDSSADHIFEFAVMGSVLCSAIDGIKNPTVGVLNIGEEEIKGNERVKEAARLIGESKLNYIGFIEGNDIFKGDTNVVVCDGFIGNIALKSSEGLAMMFSHFLKQEFKRSPLSLLSALIAMPVLHSLKKKFDPGHYNGASLLGLQGITIKSHGGADANAFVRAIEVAIMEVRNEVPQRISEQLENMLEKETTV